MSFVGATSVTPYDKHIYDRMSIMEKQVISLMDRVEELEKQALDEEINELSGKQLAKKIDKALDIAVCSAENAQRAVEIILDWSKSNKTLCGLSISYETKDLENEKDNKTVINDRIKRD